MKIYYIYIRKGRATDMIRRKRLVSSIMAGVMSGLLVVGNIAAFPGNIMAQEDDSMQVRSIYTAVKDINSDEDNYKSLDESAPIEFGGTYIKYNSQTIELSETAIYLDGSLSDEIADKYPYVYNDITKALGSESLKQGTEESPMTVYVAPYVYWIDDPAATDTMQPDKTYGVPYGMIIDSDYLTIEGLTKDPYNVVFAGNRGQSHASNGNYTMFRFNCKGALTVKNITIGNYCSVDLKYPLLSELNVDKRTSTITQAQLADMSGDKMFADNCNFISRLNLDPIGGALRSLYNNCHFESTDDAINGNAVFVGCDFDFYGNRPLYSSYNTGSTFLGCTFNSVVLNVEAEPMQYFTKEGGTITAVDCAYKSNFSIPFGIAWTKYPDKSLKCYQYNITHNGESIIIAGKDAAETVDMTGKQVLNAYRIEDGGKVYYNTYNLLKGSDDWDPLDVKDIAVKSGADSIATQLNITSTADTIESGSETATLTADIKYFYGDTDTSQKITYSVADEYKAYVSIKDNKDGNCVVEGINNEDEAKEVIIEAATESGLCAATAITVKPSKLTAPSWTKLPEVINNGDGTLKADYKLNLGDRADMSVINWYRCSDANGSDPVLVAVSTMDNPQYTYTLTAGDIGYYICATVAPKNIRSDSGDAIKTVYSEAISAKDIKTKNYTTDFSDFPTVKQPEIKPGFWTVDTYRPADTASFGSWKGEDTDTPWVYGETGNGSVGAGIYQGTQGSRLMYTPVEGEYGDMTVKLVADPAKTAGQGFGSAGQYMDVCVKFDTSTLTGYALRIVRTKAASNAVTFVLVKYDNGNTSYISDEVIASCFLTGCEITLKAEGGKLTAHVETPTAQLADQAAAGYVHVVDLTADIDANAYGGVAIQHTGTTGTGGWQNSTMLHSLSIEWAGDTNQNPVVKEDADNSATDGTTVSDLTTKGNADTDSTGSTDNSSGTVKTGDTLHMGLYAALSAVSAAVVFGLGYVCIRKRRG